MLPVGPGGRYGAQGTGRKLKIPLPPPKKKHQKPNPDQCVMSHCLSAVSRRLPHVSLSAAMPTACDVAFVPVTTVSFTSPSLLHFFQNSLIKRIKGENVYVKHSNLMLEVGIGTHQCMPVCVVDPSVAYVWT